MKEAVLIYPMLAMVLLTAAVLAVLFRSRVRAVREGKVTARYYKVYQDQSEPDYAIKPARHFTNLFESPTLFYAACLTAMVTHQVTMLMQALAWIYVLLRMIHAYVHLGTNKIPRRIAVYFRSWLVLLGMWISITAGVSMAL
jgi:hypothetical protein